MNPGKDYVGISTPFYCHDGNGNIVLQKRSSKARDEHGRWDPGSGKLEKGRTLEENVKKEVREEYGCECIIQDSLPPHGIFRTQNGKKTHWLAIPFFVKVDTEEVVNNEPEKFEEIKWFEIDDLPENLHTGFGDTLDQFRGKIEKVIGERKGAKSLKFYEPLPENVLKEKKDTTWRIGDEKNIECGDNLRLLNGDQGNREFGRAKVLWTKNTRFGQLTEEDREGHESFESEKEMYETYSRYYDTDVGPETKVKVIKFELITDG